MSVLKSKQEMEIEGVDEEMMAMKEMEMLDGEDEKEVDGEELVKEGYWERSGKRVKV
jgi:hypothetical protein